ncbi:MAG: esterase [candidate division BRC1 bacterium ADurb.BinA364]|nr:MAG: esterase [candidate division BRC1 bacterium ADurb.BinA364]
MRRAAKCLDILESLPYVDKERLCAYGNSMGAFLTVALAAQYPERLKAIAITAGGVSLGLATAEQCEKIKAPAIIFHGSADGTVPPDRSEQLQTILDKNGVPNERIVFDGIGHNAHADKADEVYAAMREWFQKNGVLR